MLASGIGASSGCGKRCIAARNIGANNQQNSAVQAVNFVNASNSPLSVVTSNNISTSNNNAVSQVELSLPLIQYSTASLAQTPHQSHYQLLPIHGHIRPELIKNNGAVDLTVNTTQSFNPSNYSNTNSPQFQAYDNQLLIGMANNQSQHQHFSQGHVISSAAGSSRVIGQPIIYPIPVALNPTPTRFHHNLNEAPNCYDLFPPTYSHGKHFF